MLIKLRDTRIWCNSLKRSSKRLVRMYLSIWKICSELASRTWFHPRYPPGKQSKGIKHMLLWFSKVTKSTISELIPLFYGEIVPLIFVIIVVFIIGSNPLREPLFLSLFIINNINKFKVNWIPSNNLIRIIDWDFYY